MGKTIHADPYVAAPEDSTAASDEFTGTVVRVYGEMTVGDEFRCTVDLQNSAGEQKTFVVSNARIQGIVELSALYGEPVKIQHDSADPPEMTSIELVITNV